MLFAGTELCNRPRWRYRVPMPSSLLARTTSGLRLLALALLVLGLLAKPVLVAACDLGDMTQAGLQFLASDAAGDPTGDECCPGQACGECCTAATMLPVAASAGRAMPLDARPQATAWVGSEPVPLPVAHRPPIRA